MNTKLYDKHEDQSPQNSKVSLVAEALPGLTGLPLPFARKFQFPFQDQSSNSACFENALIPKITLGKIIVSYQNDNLSLTFLLLTKILIQLVGPKIQWYRRIFHDVTSPRQLKTWSIMGASGRNCR